MAGTASRLILSFIGNTDLRFAEPRGEDMSPILRLLLASLDPQSALQHARFIPAECTQLVLLDDDRTGRNERARFCEQLRQQLPQLGLGTMRLERHPIAMLAGPTDLDALYEQVWAAIPTSGPTQTDEVIFHVTSGTPAMQLTLMLASQSLRLEGARLFETSREQQVRELHPPYALALRKKRERATLAYSQPLKLSDAARRGLIPHTLVDDPLAQQTYAALYKAATARKQAPRVLISGAVGCGKWHAARQFAHWRGGAVATWSDPQERPELPEGTTLLARRLDDWPLSAQQALAQLERDRPDLAMVATLRNDRRDADSTGARAALPGAARIELPPLGARTDVVALAEALAQALGIAHGKLRERLQFELLTDRFPRNLHDLKTRLASAHVLSPTMHPQRTAYLQARELCDTQMQLEEAWRIVMGMDFGPQRHSLDEVLDVIRAAVVRRALAEGRTQLKVGDLLGFRQQKVHDILQKPLNLNGWPDFDDVV